jgi:carbamoyltransferase
MSGRTKRATAPWVLGLSASHNGAACLLHGDQIVAAMQEERLSRIKRDRVFGGQHCLAISYCLNAAGIRPADLNLVVACVQGRARSPEQDAGLNPQLQLVANQVPLLTISHHMGHAMSAFATSGFEDAAVLVVDGVGSPFSDLASDQRAVAIGEASSWEMLSIYRASQISIEPMQQQMVANGEWLPRHAGGMPRFRTLGGMYSAVAVQIFGDPMAAGKVMGLAPYGEIAYPQEEFFTMKDGRFSFHDVVPQRFLHEHRWPEEQRAYRDLARSVQNALEVAILQLVRLLRRKTKATRLCYAGGVALNCVLNERLWRESGFRDVYIPAAAEDSGTAIGAAYWGLRTLMRTETRRRAFPDSLGRSYSRAEVETALANVPGLRIGTSGHAAVLAETVRRLQSGQPCGWFQEGSELGPRALGRRSILADARDARIRHHLNARVKERESFRPFAASILAAEAQNWFDIDGGAASPFMLRVWPVKASVRDCVPAVVHVDGTARVQTVDRADGAFYELLARFDKATGVPLLLNTSFNGPGEPIVETPEHALWCTLQIGLDFVVLGDCLVERDVSIGSLLDLVPRLTATSYTVEIPITDGRFGTALAADTSLAFRVHTPWGPRTQLVAGHLHPLLEALDGESDGWHLLGKLRKCIPSANAERWLINTLARLRGVSVLTLERR